LVTGHLGDIGRRPFQSRLSAAACCGPTPASRMNTVGWHRNRGLLDDDLRQADPVTVL
jgi:hypothetical protein